MSDSEQWAYIVQIDLPEAEYLDGVAMQTRHVGIDVLRTE